MFDQKGDPSCYQSNHPRVIQFFQNPLMWQRFDSSTEFLFGDGGSPRVQPGTDWPKVWECFISCSIPYQHVVQNLLDERCSAFAGGRHHYVTTTSPLRHQPEVRKPPTWKNLDDDSGRFG